MTKPKLVAIPGQPGIARAGRTIKAARADNKTHKSGIKYRTANLERARPFRWAWEPRILIGYINLLVGEEGIGKGTFVAWILAQVTRGKLPGSLAGHASNVAIAGDEDNFDHIWVPRLKAAGANLNRVQYIDSGPSGVLDVKADSEELSEFVGDLKIAVLYFDQLLDNLGYTDTWKDKQIRDALAPLRRVAQEADLAVLAAMHPNKRGGSFRDRVSGSPAFNALSRSSLYVARHPHDAERVVAVRAKGNYAGEAPGFEFRIEETIVDNPPTKHRRRALSITSSRIVDQRDSLVRTADVLDAKPDRRRDDSQRGVARNALAAMFADGKPRRAKAVRADVSKLGASERAISDAARDLGLRKYQDDAFPAQWWWAPPSGAPSEDGR